MKSVSTKVPSSSSPLDHHLRNLPPELKLKLSGKKIKPILLTECYVNTFTHQEKVSGMSVPERNTSCFDIIGAIKVTVRPRGDCTSV